MILARENRFGLFDKSQRGVSREASSATTPLPRNSFRCWSTEKVESDQITLEHFSIIKSLTSAHTHDSLQACQCAADDHAVHCGMQLPSKSLWLRLQNFVCSFEKGGGGGGDRGGTGFRPSVATARPIAEMNNFEPLINRQNFHHTRYSSESDIFRTALLSWLRNWFAVYRYQNW
jgi:hypothetical protein